MRHGILTTLHILSALASIGAKNVVAYEPPSLPIVKQIPTHPKPVNRKQRRTEASRIRRNRPRKN